VFLTAGHCTEALTRYSVKPENISVSFSPNAFLGPWRAVKNYVTHPEYWWGPASNPHDVGVLILREPVTDILPAELAPPGFLDGLASSRDLKNAKFAVVGYGINEEFKFDGNRRIAYSEFLSLHKAWLYMSQNVHTGDSGTCYGDSGGPTFWQKPDGTEVLVAVTSWGDMMCVATGINYRIDIETSRSFIDSVIANLDA